jgi:hypothetical protein
VRLLTVDGAAVLRAAAAVPDWDQIIVVVQSPIRGGSGGDIAVTSLNPGYVIDADIIGVMLHEFGHSFANLADEYTSLVDLDPCSDINASLTDQCEPNVTDETRATHIKWRRWFLPGTPIPTIGALAGARNAGLWEGARYLTDDMYRQCFDGRMKTATQPFCRVDAEAILLKLYAGWGGTPAAGIYTIEPGTKSPAGSPVSVDPGETRRLQARVLGPVMGGSLRIQWFVNNLFATETTAASGALVSYDFLEYDPGRSWTITLKVTDQSSQIHSTQRNSTLSQTSWTVRVNGLCTDCTR